MIIANHLRRSLPIAVVLAGTLFMPATTVFGQYGAMRWYQRAAQQQWQYLQKQKQAMDEQQQQEYDAFMKRFDTNKNGKIDGKEKGPAQKYLRKLELGQDPDKSIKSLGRPSRASGKTRMKPASTK